MNRALRPLTLLLPLLAACGEDSPKIVLPPPPVTPPTGTELLNGVQLRYGAAAPLTPTSGDFDVLSNLRGVASTTTGLALVTLSGSRTGTIAREVPLSTSGFGPAASAVVAVQRPGEPARAFFLPTGAPQIGMAEVSTEDFFSNLSESILAVPLDSSYPSALLAPGEGPAASALWVVDSVFGPGGSVRAYPWSGCCAAWAEDAARRFKPSDVDVDGDGAVDVAVLGRMSFVAGGAVGLVSFSYAAPAPAGAAGGVYAFDAASGAALGAVVLPAVSTSTTELEFVQSVRGSDDSLFVVTTRKSSAFADLGGRLVQYRVSSWQPLAFTDEDPARPFDQPYRDLPTHAPNAVGMAAVGNLVLTVAAPFGADAELEAWSMGAMVQRRALVLGPVYQAGFYVPGDPRIYGRSVYLGTEAGVLGAVY